MKSSQLVREKVINVWDKLQQGTLTFDGGSKVSYQAQDGWQDAIHMYFYSILTEEIHHGGKISCLTDQILCLGALRVHPPHFGFQCANAFTIRCSALQHGLFSILVQAVRLRTSLEDASIYKAFSSPGMIAS